MREATRRGDRGGFQGVHPCPSSSADVPDERADGSGPGPGAGPDGGAGRDAGVAEPHPPRRFFGAIRLDPDRAGRDMGTVAEEVLQHLTTLPGAEVEVSVEISAKVPDGVNRTVRRIVEENCRTLRFRACGFEEE